MNRSCKCGQDGAERFAVLHHMPCAYVGPTYDFIASLGGYSCPKCGAVFAASGCDSEILGYAWRCPACGAEWVEEASP